MDLRRVRPSGGTRESRERLFKVSWDPKEPNRLGPFYPPQRQIAVGTTLAVDWKTRTIRALLTSDLDYRQQDDRDLMLHRLVDEGLLRPGSEALGPDGLWLRFGIRAEIMGGLMRVRGTARMLHITTGR